ncbi:MAG: hypothetical protein SGPRY_008417 [Prymnesium sp.]
MEREAELSGQLALSAAEGSLARVHALLLHAELEAADASLLSSQRGEASALRLARAYRGFAAGGAEQLQAVARGIGEARERVEARVERLHDATRLALRSQLLASLLRLPRALGMLSALARWRMQAMRAQCERVLRLRRRADAEMGGRRAQMAAAQRTHEEKLSSQRREMTSEVEKLRIDGGTATRAEGGRGGEASRGALQRNGDGEKCIAGFQLGMCVIVANPPPPEPL